MKNNMKFLLSILSLLFVLSACKKYEEGPAFSLLTKKARITGSWKAEKVISKSGVMEFVYYDEVMKILKDGDYEFLVGSSIEITGIWDFSQDKEYLRLNYGEDGINNIVEYKIIRLKSKELWLEDAQGEQVNYVPL